MNKRNLNNYNNHNNYLNRVGRYNYKEHNDTTQNDEIDKNSTINNQNKISFNNNLELDNNSNAEIRMPIKPKSVMIVIILIVLFFCLLMLFIVINSDYFANGGSSTQGKYKYYGDGVCRQVKYEDDILDIEDYVASVIAGEITNYSKETLKTFAVAVRTHIIKNGIKVDGDNGSCYYDVNNITQSYKSENKSQEHIDAAKETKGLIITIDGEVARGLYDASCVYTAEQARMLDANGDYTDDNYYIRYGSEEIGGINFQPVLKTEISNIVGSLQYYAEKVTTEGACFENYGYGMSQNGAQYFETIEGYDWEKIINYYYQNKATIMTIEKFTGTTVLTEGVVYKQGDPAWGSIPLGNSSSTMANAGCAVTSIAIGISFSKTEVNAPSFDAGVFIRALNNGNCFTSTGAIYWACPAISEIAPSVGFINIIDTSDSTNQEKINLINSYPQDRFIVITHYANETTYSHYVNFHEFLDSNTYMSRDPGVGAFVPHSISEIDQIVLYKY